METPSCFRPVSDASHAYPEKGGGVRFRGREGGVRGPEGHGPQGKQRFCGGGRTAEIRRCRMFHRVFIFETICYGMFQNRVSMFHSKEMVVYFTGIPQGAAVELMLFPQ